MSFQAKPGSVIVVGAPSNEVLTLCVPVEPGGAISGRRQEMVDVHLSKEQAKWLLSQLREQLDEND